MKVAEQLEAIMETNAAILLRAKHPNVLYELNKVLRRKQLELENGKIR